ncbi:hypothetical protein QZH41_010106, partial [Actinostola sp. cb2023]
CELLPDDNAVDKHLRILFWAGLRQGIKDKARHKKDQCKTFGELITAARYGEKEANNSTQAPKRVSRSNPVQQLYPTDEYNRKVPMTVGTNVTKECKEYCQELHGQQFLQKIKASSAWWRVYQSLQTRDKFINRGQSNIKLASRSPVTVGAYQSVVV